MTVRHGPKVTRESFDDLDEAVDSMRARAEAIRSAGELRPVKSLRAFEPQDLVAGRVEISTGSFLRRGRDAGVDVMGDGRFVPYKGGVKRLELDAEGEASFESIKEVLR
jgi:hypothetical protein